MAEETAAVEAETEGVTAPPEDQKTEDNQQETITVEALAAEEGWVPKDQFTGDPEKWRPAHEYLRVGKQAIRAMSRDLKATRDEVSRIARTSADMTAQAVANERTRLEAIHSRAVEDGDAATAKQAVEGLVKLNNQPQQDQLPPETVDFMDRNKAWFGVDPLATSRAKRLAAELAQDGYDTAEQLRQVDRAIRKEFPEHFPKAKPPAGTQTAAARNAGTASRKKGFADMPAESQTLAKEYLARHGVPLEKFAESFWADPANAERKVG